MDLVRCPIRELGVVASGGVGGALEQVVCVEDVGGEGLKSEVSFVIREIDPLIIDSKLMKEFRDVKCYEPRKHDIIFHSINFNSE